jgi:hypothetical protein
MTLLLHPRINSPRHIVRSQASWQSSERAPRKHGADLVRRTGTQNVSKMGLLFGVYPRPRLIPTTLDPAGGHPWGVITTYQMILTCILSICIHPEINKFCVTVRRDEKKS